MKSAFIAIYCESNFYKNYDQISEDKRNYILPLVIMLNRWDGKIGFIGGHIDDNEDDLTCIVRETSEEIGYDISKEQREQIFFVCSDTYENKTTSLYALNVDEAVFREILLAQHNATHYLSEGTASAIHFVNYTHNRSFDNFMQNNFASTVKEEIYSLIKKLSWEIKYNLTALKDN